ncbi:hypothetical protein [Mesorhizobium sp.]|uniref:SCO4402 family protein n=2 Tax=Mesorhizobium sp. TaxID=1871066 RepID=UPI000FE4ED0C|nr:hypothetical protein [Mesorhizobium sp.]RWD44533.1 MAG: hypothetical protein EOS59_23290 [Mesorhizobium sp.]RWE84458.1 MAG: hypothetical protein EOS49_20925 [Mesorhizobium sp.]RWE91384.1 MAG: hypothetical protein EOS68_28185 [Mesorhizobium sp.]RWF16096.1 MAG: hypothetical protein EOS25_21390 [Mesorhizobium sp.]TIX44721.1 MAG: hypothetical protein E5V19_00355 [Mesorhizobium sp.]
MESGLQAEYVGSMRDDLISCLRDLSDAEYQRLCWVERRCPEGREYDNIQIVMRFMLDDTWFLFRPEDEVGRTVDTIDQAKSVQTVSRLLYDLDVDFSASAQQYMSSPSWNDVVASAKEALFKLTDVG